MLKRFSFIYLLLAAATIALVVSLLLTLNVLSDELKKQQHRYRESLVWSASQLEREGMFFMQELLLFEKGDEAVDGESVQQAFDIFWSRTETLQKGQAGKLAIALSGIEDSGQMLINVHDTLERCDSLVTRIVAGERRLVMDVYRQFEALMPSVHRFVQGMGNRAMQSQEEARLRFLVLKQKAVLLLLAGFCSGTLLAILLLTRQRALNRLRESLENQVAERTEELSKANRALNDEVLLHRQARDEMRKLWNLLNDIVALMPSQLVGVDTGGKVMLWNRKMAEVSGVTSVNAVGQPLDENLPWLAQWLADSQELLAQGRAVHLHKYPYPDSSESLVDIVAYPLSESDLAGVVVRIDDVTDRAKLDEHMIQSEKMVSIGGLAAGMAHEINNPLAGIVQNLQVIKQRIDPSFEANREAASAVDVSLEDVNRYFEERKLPKLFAGIQESAQKAVKIVSNLQTFSRSHPGGFYPSPVADLLNHALALVRNDYQFGSNGNFSHISIVRDYGEELPQIECQTGQLQQVFFNILKNAVQALAQDDDAGKEPTIVLKVTDEEGFACIEISDNGPGMDEHVRKRIFEPFFTTREVGVGAGLGLSVAYMIVCDKHGGSFEVESSAGKGSRFIVKIPWVHEVVSKQKT